jgi:hypothetical protein
MIPHALVYAVLVIGLFGCLAWGIERAGLPIQPLYLRLIQGALFFSAVLTLLRLFGIGTGHGGLLRLH